MTLEKIFVNRSSEREVVNERRTTPKTQPLYVLWREFILCLSAWIVLGFELAVKAVVSALFYGGERSEPEWNRADTDGGKFGVGSICVLL